MVTESEWKASDTETPGLAEITHDAKSNKMRAIG